MPQTTPTISIYNNSSCTTLQSTFEISEGNVFYVYLRTNMDRKPDIVTPSNDSIFFGYVSGQSRRHYNTTTNAFEYSVWCYQIRAPRTSGTSTISFRYEARTQAQVATGAIYNSAVTASITISTIPDNQATSVVFYKDNTLSASTTHITVDTGETFTLIVHSNRSDAPTISHSSFTINYTKSVGQYHYYTMVSNIASNSYTVPVTYLIDNVAHRQALTQNLTVTVNTPKVQPTIEFAISTASTTKITTATIDYGQSLNLLVFTNISEAPDHTEPNEVGVTAGTRSGNVYPFTLSPATAGNFVISFKYNASGTRKTGANNFLLRVRNVSAEVTSTFDGFISSEGGAVMILQRDTDKIWHTTMIMDSTGEQIAAEFPTVSVTSGTKAALTTFVNNLTVEDS